MQNYAKISEVKLSVFIFCSSTTHPKFDPTGVRTHNLQIMTVHFMSLSTDCFMKIPPQSSEQSTTRDIRTILNYMTCRITDYLLTTTFQNKESNLNI